jgi:hypothetical protein
MVTVVYEGPAPGVRRLEKMLTDEGLAVSYQPPMETRGVGPDLVMVVLYIGDKILDEAVGVSVDALARKAVTGFKEKFSGHGVKRADVESDLDI